jgi:hypothetical protein
LLPACFKYSELHSDEYSIVKQKFCKSLRIPQVFD